MPMTMTKPSERHVLHEQQQAPFDVVDCQLIGAKKFVVDDNDDDRTVYSATTNTAPSPAMRKSHFPPFRLMATAVTVSLLTYFPVGYHYSVLNVAHDVFVQLINSSYVSHYSSPLTETRLNVLSALAVSIWQGGAAIGSLNACWIMDRFGRRNTLLVLTSVWQMVGSTLMALASPCNCFEILIIGRFCAGLSSGLVCVTLRVFLSECSPDEYRGTVNSVGGFFMFMGVMSAMVLGLEECLGTEEGSAYLLGLCIVPAFICLCIYAFFPSTPKYLYLSRNNSTQASLALKFYHGSSVNVDGVLEQLEQEKRLTKDQLSFSDAWREKSVRLPLMISLVAGLAYSSTGIDIFDAYSTELFETLGLARHDAQLASTLFNIAGVVGSIIAIFCVDRLPRRKFLLYTLTACLLCSVGIVIVGSVHLASTPSVYLGLSAVVLLSVTTFAYGLGPASVLESLFAEVSPHKIRTVAGTISETGFWASNVFYMFIFPLSLHHIGCYSILIFALPLLICVVYFVFKLPETGKMSAYEVANKMRVVQKSVSTLPILSSGSVDETNNNILEAVEFYT